MLTRLAQMISVVLTSLIAGLSAGRWFGAPASREYTKPIFTEVQQRIDQTVRQWAPGLILGTIVMLALTLALLRREFRGVRFLLTAGALVFVVALTISTQLVNVPADWAEARDRWETFHTLRTVFAILALCLIAASVTLADCVRRMPGVARAA